MPRGRARGYDDQREQILARASKLFARRGYTATSMNEVAEACGVSKPSLYHYFRDKQQLLLEIAAAHVARLEALVEEVGAETHEPEGRVRRLITAFLEVYAGAQAEHRVLTEDVRFLPPADRRRVLDGERKVVAAFADAIAEARPELRTHELDKPLTMLLFGMMNWMFTWLKPRGELSHADMAPVVADLFFGGLGAVRAPGEPAHPLSAHAQRRHRMPHPAKLVVAIGLAAAATLVNADINVGVTVSATGPAASLGIPEKNTIALMPQTIGGQKVNYIVLDDASDTTTAVANASKLITESKVDIVLGSTTTPNSLAMIDVAAESQTPMISMAASSTIVEPVDAKRRWIFKTPQNDIMMSLAIATHMQLRGIKTVGFIGFNDAYGEGWFREFSKVASVKGLTIVASERYSRTDTSVTGQVLKLVSAKPDAILIAASGTPAVLPQRTLKERGYAGQYYQTHGVANNDFLRVGGKDVEGTYLPAGPVLVAAQLPPNNPVRASALDYIAKYEAANGKGSVSTFGAHAWDAGRLMSAAAAVALKTAQPGTPAFRAALRDALEKVSELHGAHGVFNMSPTDHLGLDQRARVMVKIENGTWKYQP